MTDKDYSKVNFVLNTKGTKCPIPSMKVRMNMSKLPPGGIMKVISDSNHATVSIPRYCRNYGHKILLTEEKEDVLTFIIQKRLDEKD
ncbi:MAG: sulfurtransferase TusA family protein [Candidatus Heimdallarchaeota archaeon]